MKFYYVVTYSTFLVVIYLISGYYGNPIEQSNIERSQRDRPDDARPLWLSLRDTNRDHHGRIKMGVADSSCDDGVTNITVDWDGLDETVHTCYDDSEWDTSKSHQAELLERLKNGQYKPLTPKNLDNPENCYWVREMIKVNANWDCLKQSDIPIPDHICLDQSIEYEDNPPRSGSHRPLWPRYGEYTYCPPQRWAHSLEHGAVVMLYDPCVLNHPALKKDLETLNRTVTDCLYRHVITPYKGMSQPFALVTYGCRLMMDRVSEDLAALFISQTAKHGLEQLADDGQYNTTLLHPAQVVFNSGLNDDNLCPKWRSPAEGNCKDISKQLEQENAANNV